MNKIIKYKMSNDFELRFYINITIIPIVLLYCSIRLRNRTCSNKNNNHNCVCITSDCIVKKRRGTMRLKKSNIKK